MRKQNPNSLKNLKRGNPEHELKKNDPRTKEIAKMGVDARKLKLIAQEDILAKLAETNDWEEIISNAIERAKHNAKDFEVLRDTMGQKPREQFDVLSDNKIEFVIGGLKDYAD